MTPMGEIPSFDAIRESILIRRADRLESENANLREALENEQKFSAATKIRVAELETELEQTKARLLHITDGFRREHNDIEQTCGKALGYPRYCDDQANFPDAIEEDGVCIGDHVAASIAAELANRYRALLARCKQLEEVKQ